MITENDEYMYILTPNFYFGLVIVFNNLLYFIPSSRFRSSRTINITPEIIYPKLPISNILETRVDVNDCPFTISINPNYPDHLILKIKNASKYHYPQIIHNDKSFVKYYEIFEEYNIIYIPNEKPFPETNYICRKDKVMLVTE